MKQTVFIEIPGKPYWYQIAPLHGWEMVGTRNLTTGALARNTRTGIYCQVNFGSLRGLPQDAVHKAFSQKKLEETRA
jgi:hypothetical protein